MLRKTRSTKPHETQCGHWIPRVLNSIKRRGDLKPATGVTQCCPMLGNKILIVLDYRKTTDRVRRDDANESTESVITNGGGGRGFETHFPQSTNWSLGSASG